MQRKAKKTKARRHSQTSKAPGVRVRTSGMLSERASQAPVLSRPDGMPRKHGHATAVRNVKQYPIKLITTARKDSATAGSWVRRETKKRLNSFASYPFFCHARSTEKEENGLNQCHAHVKQADL